MTLLLEFTFKVKFKKLTLYIFGHLRNDRSSNPLPSYIYVSMYINIKHGHERNDKYFTCLLAEKMKNGNNDKTMVQKNNLGLTH